MIRCDWSLGVLIFLVACGDPAPKPGPFTAATPVEGLPPIPYPAELFRQQIEGEVLLYLVIDSSGYVVPDSTRIATSSGRAEFDAAALEAAPDLRFLPARRGDTAVTAPLQVPIKFSLPGSNQPTDDGREGER